MKDRVHVFRVTDETEKLKIARLSPVAANELDTFMKTPAGRRVTMAGSKSAEEMANSPNLVEMNPADDPPFAVSAIYRGDTGMAEGEARKKIADSMGRSAEDFDDVRVSDGYPGDPNSVDKMLIEQSQCLTAPVKSGYTTFWVDGDGDNGRELRCSIVDWGQSSDQKLAIFDAATDEFLELMDATTGSFGSVVLKARKVQTAADFDIRVSSAPIGQAFSYGVDADFEAEKDDPTDYEAQEVCPALRQKSPMIALGSSDGDAYEGSLPTKSLRRGDETTVPEEEVEGLGGASINGFVRSGQTAIAPKTTDKARLVVLENLFE